MIDKPQDLLVLLAREADLRVVVLREAALGVPIYMRAGYKEANFFVAGRTRHESFYVAANIVFPPRRDWPRVSWTIMNQRLDLYKRSSPRVDDRNAKSITVESNHDDLVLYHPNGTSIKITARHRLVIDLSERVIVESDTSQIGSRS